MIYYFSEFKNIFNYKTKANRLQFNIFIIIATVLIFVSAFSFNPNLLGFVFILNFIPFLSLLKRRINSAFENNIYPIWLIVITLLIMQFSFLILLMHDNLFSRLLLPILKFSFPLLGILIAILMIKK